MDEWMNGWMDGMEWNGMEWNVNHSKYNNSSSHKSTTATKSLKRKHHFPMTFHKVPPFPHHFPIGLPYTDGRQVSSTASAHKFDRRGVRTAALGEWNCPRPSHRKVIIYATNFPQFFMGEAKIWKAISPTEDTYSLTMQFNGGVVESHWIIIWMIRNWKGQWRFTADIIEFFDLGRKLRNMTLPSSDAV